MDGLIHWRDVVGANIEIFGKDETAGSGRLTIVVPVMAEAKEALASFGLR